MKLVDLVREAIADAQSNPRHRTKRASVHEARSDPAELLGLRPRGRGLAGRIEGVEVTANVAVIGRRSWCTAKIEPPLGLGLSIEKRSSVLGHPDRVISVDDEVDRALLVQAREHELARRCLVGEGRDALLRIASLVDVLDITDSRARAELPAHSVDTLPTVVPELALIARSLVRERSALGRADHTKELAEQWTAAARELGGRFDSEREELIVPTRYGEARVWTELSPEGWHTRAVLELVSELGFTFELEEAGRVSFWQRLFYGKKTGDPAFDQRFFLRGQKSELGSRFGSDTREALVKLYDSVDELVLDKKGVRVGTASLLDSSPALIELVQQLESVARGLLPSLDVKSAYR